MSRHVWNADLHNPSRWIPPRRIRSAISSDITRTTWLAVSLNINECGCVLSTRSLEPSDFAQRISIAAVADKAEDCAHSCERSDDRAQELVKHVPRPN